MTHEDRLHCSPRTTELKSFYIKGLNDTLYNVHSDPELGPKALLEVAAHPTVTRNVYISKDGGGPLTGRNLDTAKVHIHFLPPRATRSLFAPDYRGRVKVTDNVDTYQQMLYRDFLREFGSKIGRNDVIHAITKSVSDQNAEALARWTQGLPEGGEALAMKWLQHRAVVDADGYIESNRAQWTPADAQNEVMKGLLSYELAYRRYIQLLLAESVKCKAQYADVPLNLISNKVTKAGKPTEQYDNFGIMDLIIEEYKKSKVESPGLSPLRVIYCVPPVLHVPMVERSLAECLALKKNLKYAGFIAGMSKNFPTRLEHSVRQALTYI